MTTEGREREIAERHEQLSASPLGTWTPLVVIHEDRGYLLAQLTASRERVAALEGALEAIIYASDQCQGHRDCGHSMDPWKTARELLALTPGRAS